jgi:hypothetical protein
VRPDETEQHGEQSLVGEGGIRLGERLGRRLLGRIGGEQRKVAAALGKAAPGGRAAAF